jgi:hypothetical protein
MATTPEQFHNRGRDIVTEFAKAMDDFNSYARVFEVRGGAVGLGEEFGEPTEAMVVLRNDLAAFFAANNRQQVLDLYRADY